MLTVRYPNGQTIQYNEATYLEHDAYGSRIFNKKGGDQIARVQHSAGAILEFDSPCRISNAIEENQFANVNAELKAIKQELRSIKKELKKGVKHGKG